MTDGPTNRRTDPQKQLIGPQKQLGVPQKRLREPQRQLGGPQRAEEAGSSSEAAGRASEAAGKASEATGRGLCASWEALVEEENERKLSFSPYVVVPNIIVPYVAAAQKEQFIYRQGICKYNLRILDFENLSSH